MAVEIKNVTDVAPPVTLASQPGTLGGFFSPVLRWLWGRFGGTVAEAGGGVCATVSLAPRVSGTPSVAARVTATVSLESC